MLTSYPSPFNSSAVVNFHAVLPGDATISITDISGRLIRQWVENVDVSGEVKFNVDGAGLSAGTYLLKIEQLGRVGETRLVLVK